MKTNYEEMEAGRELDHLVEQRVFEREPCKEWRQEFWGSTNEVWIKENTCSHNRCYPAKFPPRRSTDWSAMGQMIEKLKNDDFWWSATYKSNEMGDGSEGPPHYHVRFRCVRGATRGDHYAIADTLPRATAIAALKARS